MGQLHLVREPEYRRQATVVQALLQELLEAWPAEGELGGDALPVMVHSVAQAQSLRLDAAVQLAVTGLAFTVSPFVRLAYDEWLWLAYFATEVAPHERTEVLGGLSSRELVLRYRAQHKVHGTAGQEAYGFAATADEELEAQVPAIEKALAELDERLAWNRRRGDAFKEPSLYKFAKERVDSEVTGLHSFLSTIPSQFMHFSAYRLTSGVSRSDAGTASYRNPATEGHQSGFTLGWCAVHALRLLKSIRKWDPTLAQVLDASLPHWELRAQKTYGELSRYGFPPLVEAWQLVEPS